MPFNNNRIYYVGALFLIVIVFGLIGWAAVSNAPAKAVKTSQVITVTVLNNIGIKEIEITNNNKDEIGKGFIFTLMTLPAQFNCTRGDSLDIKVTTKDGYVFNGWWFSPMDIWHTDNPATLYASTTNPFGNIINNNEIIMIPNCIRVPQPTVTPTPTAVPPE